MTSDERREVAARLREAAIDDGHVGRPYGEQGFQVTLRRIIGTSNPMRPTLYARLADLIDPKCSMDAIDTGEMADYDCCEHIMHCKNCDAEFGHVLYSEDGDVSMDDKPKFCPNCGASVTDGGDSR